MKKENYIKSSIEELRKVAWPTTNQVIRASIIVFVFILISAGFLAAVDQGLNFARQQITLSQPVTPPTINTVETPNIEVESVEVEGTETTK